LNPEPAPAHVQQATKEQLAEKVRLLYVALTRACHRCYLVSAPYPQKKSTALAWLLNGQRKPCRPGCVFWRRRRPIRRTGKIAGWSIAEKSPGNRRADLPLEPGKPWSPEKPPPQNWLPNPVRREIKPSWFLSSFTQLSHQAFSPHAECAGFAGLRRDGCVEPKLARR
jgi:exodeoxyribonuclease V beta subunit